MNNEIDDLLDELADLATIWVRRRESGMDAPMIREILVRACGEVHAAAPEGDRVPRAWLKGQFDSVDVT